METCILITSYLVTNIKKVIENVGIFSVYPPKNRITVLMYMRHKNMIPEIWNQHQSTFPEKLDYDYMIQYLEKMQFIRYVEKEDKFALGARMLQPLYLFSNEVIEIEELIEKNRQSCFKSSPVAPKHNDFFRKVFKMFPSRLSEQTLLQVVTQHTLRLGMQILDALELFETGNKPTKQLPSSTPTPKNDSPAVHHFNKDDSEKFTSRYSSDGKLTHDEEHFFIQDALRYSLVQHKCYCAIDMSLLFQPHEMECYYMSERTTQLHEFLWMRLSEYHNGFYLYSITAVGDAIDYAFSHSTTSRFPEDVSSFVYSFTQAYIQDIVKKRNHINTPDAEVKAQKEDENSEVPSMDMIFAKNTTPKLIIPDRVLSMFPSTLERIFPSINTLL